MFAVIGDGLWVANGHTHHGELKKSLPLELWCNIDDLMKAGRRSESLLLFKAFLFNSFELYFRLKTDGS